MHDDDSLATKPRDTTPEATLADKGDPTIEPADFDFAEWLQGLEPTRAAYTLAGCRFELQARSPEWYAALKTELGPDVDPLVFDFHFLAGHITSRQVTVDELRIMWQHAAPEVREMVTLAMDIDSKPRRLVNPIFLLPASA